MYQGTVTNALLVVLICIELFRIVQTISLTKKEEKEMANLDQILADVTAEKTAVDSLVALTGGLKQQLADALSGTTLPDGVQAKIDAVFAGVETNKQEIVAAIVANTPSAPATGDAPADPNAGQ